MTDGGWTWKRLARPVAEKFSPENVHYCQQFVNYVHTVDLYKLKFFNESGIKLPDVGKPNYSPEMNPAEYVINKRKTIMKPFEFQKLLRDNLHVAVHEALKEVTTDDMRKFFKYTGYINI